MFNIKKPKPRSGGEADAITMASADSKVKELLKREKSGEIISLAEKDGEVVNEVVKLLGDSDWLVRKNAAEALGLIVGKYAGMVTEAIPQLTEVMKAAVSGPIGLLRDSESKVRANAAGAVGRIATKDSEVVRAAVPRLIELLQDSGAEVRASVAWTLGRIGENTPEVVKAAVPVLIELLRNTSAWVRGNAAEVLGLTGEAAALPMLRRLAADSTKIGISQGGTLMETTVGKVARQAIEKIETRQRGMFGNEP